MPIRRAGCGGSVRLAVGPRAPGPGPAWADAQVTAGLAPGVLAVGPGVVGQDPFDGDAQGREPGGRPGEEGRAGRGGLVGQVFGVGEAGVVVEGGVQVGPAGAGLVAASFGSAEGLVAAAVGDPAELLDVDVDQLARAGAFVSSATTSWPAGLYTQSRNSTPRSLRGCRCGGRRFTAPTARSSVFVRSATTWPSVHCRRRRMWLLSGTSATSEGAASSPSTRISTRCRPARSALASWSRSGQRSPRSCCMPPMPITVAKPCWLPIRGGRPRRSHRG